MVLVSCIPFEITAQDSIDATLPDNNENIEIQLTSNSLDNVSENIIASENNMSILAANATYKRKEPWAAFLLSCVYPGIGQYYNGQVGKGIVMTALGTAGYGIMIAGVIKMGESEINSLSYDEGGATMTIGLLVLTSSIIWSMIDAPLSASKINRRNQALSWNINEGKTLSVHPDFAYTTVGINRQREVTYGLSLKLAF